LAEDEASPAPRDQIELVTAGPDVRADDPVPVEAIPPGGPQLRVVHLDDLTAPGVPRSSQFRLRFRTADGKIEAAFHVLCSGANRTRATQRRVTDEVRDRARLVDASAFDGRGMTATVPRAEIEGALGSSDGPPELVLDIERRAGDEVEART